MVVPTMRGNIRDPRNTSRDWRMARDRIGYPTVTTHSFRKTVVTTLDQSGLSAREIAEYLGHANSSLTQDVYMAKNTGGIRAAETMNSLLASLNLRGLCGVGPKSAKKYPGLPQKSGANLVCTV
ncbi:tyrosine-type recombinase/integrase [Cryobacterium sp. M15]|uniref:tyrosine-type recombinase/integrase n=1 Tax=Cryobacterium sp. M15 TaxID=2048291 RepID=UPI001E288778|nr:tyrosine-type recombinase/integrase [Cryobacterium sp. M15]